MKKVTKLTASILLSTAVMMPGSASAFGFGDLGLPSVPGLGGDSSATSGGSSLDNVTSSTNAVMADFVASIKSFKKALKIETSSDEKEAIAKCTAQKTCMEGNQMEKYAVMAEEVAKKMEADQKSGVKLSTEAKAIYNKGLLSYGTGILKSAAVITAVSGLASEAASNPVALVGSVGAITTLATEVPSTVTAFKNASSAIYSYASFNGIEKPEMAAAE